METETKYVNGGVITGEKLDGPEEVVNSYNCKRTYYDQNANDQLVEDLVTEVRTYSAKTHKTTITIIKLDDDNGNREYSRETWLEIGNTTQK